MYTGRPLSAGGAIAHTSSGQLIISVSTLQGNTGTGSGGAIWCDACGGILVLLGRLVDNTAGGLGGALHINGSQVVLRVSSVSRNSADIGGAIYALEAEVHVLESEVSGNIAAAGDAGAVYISGTLNIERSTVAENSAVGQGAIYLNNQGSLTSANSTYSRNSAACGGALFAGAGSSVLIGTATFFNNTASFGGCPEHIVSNALSLEFYNSIIANDLSGGASFDPYCSGPMTGGSHNLIDDNSCDTGAATFNLGAVTGLDPNLAYNGGPTRTHNLSTLPLSNAVDTGHNPACLNPWTGTALVIDQRGRTRPVDHPPIVAGGGGVTCDIGAIELQ